MIDVVGRGSSFNFASDTIKHHNNPFIPPAPATCIAWRLGIGTHSFIPQIFIKTLTGRKQAFNFEPENQVLAVKQALQEKEGIQVEQIRLIYSGKQL